MRVKKPALLVAEWLITPYLLLENFRYPRLVGYLLTSLPYGVLDSNLSE